MTDLQKILEISTVDHSHLCPRQILGARLGLLGLRALGFDAPPDKKRLLVITETDGCFADGLSAATGCTVGHRTLRVEDYGKTAAVFVDTHTGRSLRVAPALDVREQAYHHAPDEARHYFAQMQAYRTMPDEVMFSVRAVTLNTPVGEIVSRAGIRVNCDACGEEIITSVKCAWASRCCAAPARGTRITRQTPRHRAHGVNPYLWTSRCSLSRGGDVPMPERKSAFVFPIAEFSGALADLGLMLPLALALISLNGLDAAAVFVGVGVS